MPDRQFSTGHRIHWRLQPETTDRNIIDDAAMRHAFHRHLQGRGDRIAFVLTSFVFREQAVDGVVTSLGGKALRELCARARPDGFGAGDAVATAAPGLPFETVVHAVAPFWESPAWRADLLRVYQSAFALAAARDVATPLLGAGARGAPVADAAAAAAEAVAAAASAPRPPKSVSFGVADDEAFDALVRNCDCV